MENPCKGIMSVFVGNVRTQKTVQDEGYAPFIELDCRFCQLFSSEKLTSPLIVLDVGARGGFDPRLEVFGSHSRIVGFEPDKNECARMRTDIKHAGQDERLF